MIVAIDGPAGAGKSTVARVVARHRRFKGICKRNRLVGKADHGKIGQIVCGKRLLLG